MLYYRAYIAFTYVFHRNNNVVTFSSYACKLMPRKIKKKMQENLRAFQKSSFVGKIHSTKRKLRNWERISRIEL